MITERTPISIDTRNSHAAIELHTRVGETALLGRMEKRPLLQIFSDPVSDGGFLLSRQNNMLFQRQREIIGAIPSGERTLQDKANYKEARYALALMNMLPDSIREGINKGRAQLELYPETNAGTGKKEILMVYQPVITVRISE